MDGDAFLDRLVFVVVEPPGLRLGARRYLPSLPLGRHARHGGGKKAETQRLMCFGWVACEIGANKSKVHPNIIRIIWEKQVIMTRAYM